MTPDVEWAELVEPYDTAAAALGYRRLNASRYFSNEYPTLTLFNQTLFDGEATFLDFAATIVRGAPPPHVVLGFHHVQFLTRVRSGGEPQWAMTNGTPPGYPRIRVPLLIRWLESRTPEYAKPLAMRRAEDLPLVLERHRRVIEHYGDAVIAPDPQQPLEWRWAIMKAEEEEG